MPVDGHAVDIYTYIYIYIYQMDCVCQRYHKECFIRTCADDCYNCTKFTKWLPPWRKGRITCLWIKSVFECLTIGIIHETMVVHMTWVWTFFNNYIYIYICGLHVELSSLLVSDVWNIWYKIIIMWMLYKLNQFWSCLWRPMTSLGHDELQYIPRNMHTVFALLCFVVVIHWLIFPYPSGLLHGHCGNLTIAPVPAKQPWWIWINTSCEFIFNDCITTTKQSTTKPCAYFLGYTVTHWLWLTVEFGKA